MGKHKRLSGRFYLVEKYENTVVVGFVGNVNAVSLSEDEVNFIAHFYDIKQPYTYEIVNEYTNHNQVSTKNSHGFLILRK